MDRVISCLNIHWSEMFFVKQKTWLSLDDDKLPYSSAKWKQYGMQLTSTKEKRLKPVIHTAAAVGTGFIVAIYPDRIKTSLSEMLRSIVLHVEPTGNEAVRSNLCIFIDRGYLQLAKAQPPPRKNLIQIMDEELKVQFLGTCKNNASFPFILDTNAQPEKRSNGKKVVVSTYGHRSSFIAKRQNPATKVVVARHGMGKNRGARIVTNNPRFLQNKVIYEVTKGVKATGEVQRIKHMDRPRDLELNADEKAKIDHAWASMLSKVWQVTELQRTGDWFLARLFSFSSTTLHIAVNSLEAVYFTVFGKNNMHTACKDIMQLSPTGKITVQNASTEVDGDLPVQRRIRGTRSEALCNRNWSRYTKQQLMDMVENYGLTSNLPNNNRRRGYQKKDFIQVLKDAFSASADQPEIDSQRTTEPALTSAPSNISEQPQIDSQRTAESALTSAPSNISEQPQIDSLGTTEPALTSAPTNIFGKPTGEPEIDSHGTTAPALPSSPSNTFE